MSICDRAAVERIFREYKPDAVMRLAVESHLERVVGWAAFVRSQKLKV